MNPNPYPNFIAEELDKLGLFDEISRSAQSLFDSAPSLTASGNAEIKFFAAGAQSQQPFLAVRTPETLRFYPLERRHAFDKQQALEFCAGTAFDPCNPGIAPAFEFCSDKFPGMDNDQVLQRAIGERNARISSVFAKAMADYSRLPEETKAAAGGYLASRFAPFFDCCDDLPALKDFFGLLSRDTGAPERSAEFCISLAGGMARAASRMAELAGLRRFLEALPLLCRANGFAGRACAFVWNDGDNMLWLHDSGAAVLEDQGCAFFVSEAPGGRLAAHFADKESEHPSAAARRLAARSDTVRDAVLELRAGSCSYASNSLFWLFETNCAGAMQALSEAGLSIDAACALREKSMIALCSPEPCRTSRPKL